MISPSRARGREERLSSRFSSRRKFVSVARRCEEREKKRKKERGKKEEEEGDREEKKERGKVARDGIVSIA